MTLLIRVMFTALIVAGVCGQQVAQMQTATAKATLSGRVVAGDTGVPVRGAIVTLTPLNGPPTTVTTSDGGGFAFEDLPAGRYMLGVSRTGFLNTFFDPRGPTTEYFELRAGQRLDAIECRLPKAGVISGRVFDTYGDPMSEITVTAWRTDYVAPGERRLAQMRSTQTNDLGDYRLFNLPAGRYYVAAGSVPPLLAPGAARPVLNYAGGAALALTFYPGTAISADALPIAVRNNEENGGTNIRLQPVRFSRVTGIVRDSAGRPAANVFVLFNPSRADGAFYTMGAGGTITDPTGNFVVPDVPPGDYRIDVVPKAKLDGIASEGTGAMWLVHGESASVPVTVAGERLIELTIDLTSGRRITGRLLVDNQPPAQVARTKLQVVAFPVVPGSTPTSQLHTVAANVDADGVFTLSGVQGQRLIRVSGQPNLSLQRIIAGGVDVTDRIVEIGSSDLTGVEIALTTKQTLISGTVTDTTGVPLKNGAAVIVFSEDRALWTLPQNRWIKGVPVNGDHFGIPGLPPGRYLAVAVPALDRGLWADPDNLERLRALATPFTLGDGEKLTLTLVRR